MQFVNEGDDLTIGVLDFLQHGLQAFFKLTAVLGTRHHGREVEGDHAAVAQRLGNVALHNALGETLHNRGLADARLANEHGVVLSATREHLNNAANFVIASNNRVQLAGPSDLGEVTSVLFEGLKGALGILSGNALTATNLTQSSEQLFAIGAHELREGDHDVINREEIITEITAKSIRGFHGAASLGRQSRLRSTRGSGLARDDVGQSSHHREGVDAGGRHEGSCHATLLRNGGEQDVLGRDVGITRACGSGVGFAEGLPQLGCPFLRIECHANYLRGLIRLTKMAIVFCTGTRSRRNCLVVSAATVCTSR